MAEKALVSWSGGKDIALALHACIRESRREIVALLTSLTEGYDRVSMHGVRRCLLKAQARSLGYPLEEILIPQECTNEEYERLMGTALSRYRDLGVKEVVFGDVFLEDVRKYREERLARIGMKGVFPLWGIGTIELGRSFANIGFRAIVVCVDTQALDREYVGREYDDRFLSDLPTSVDPCGENGEFHTFVYDGPLFSKRIEFEKGEKVMREGRFYYCDLVPLHPGEPEESNAA